MLRNVLALSIPYAAWGRDCQDASCDTGCENECIKTWMPGAPQPVQDCAWVSGGAYSDGYCTDLHFEAEGYMWAPGSNSLVYCNPACPTGSCPTDVPKGVSAEPRCISGGLPIWHYDNIGSGDHYWGCVLVCQTDAECGDATCQKDIPIPNGSADAPLFGICAYLTPNHEVESEAVALRSCQGLDEDTCIKTWMPGAPQPVQDCSWVGGGAYSSGYCTDMHFNLGAEVEASDGCVSCSGIHCPSGCIGPNVCTGPRAPHGGSCGDPNDAGGCFCWSSTYECCKEDPHCCDDGHCSCGDGQSDVEEASEVVQAVERKLGAGLEQIYSGGAGSCCCYNIRNNKFAYSKRVGDHDCEYGRAGVTDGNHCVPQSQARSGTHCAKEYKKPSLAAELIV